MAATHEFGHSLGLAHSQINSMMSPWYQRPEDPFARDLLAQDDIDAIQKLYGKRKTPAPVLKAPGPEIVPNGGAGPKTRWQVPTYQQPVYAQPSSYSPSVYSAGSQGGYYPIQPAAPRRSNTFSWSDFGINFNRGVYSYITENRTADTKTDGDATLCADGRLDAALMDLDTMYVFKGDNYWRLTDVGVATGYPRKISDGWDGVPSPLDAALYHTATDRIYLFQVSRLRESSRVRYGSC